MKQRDGLAGTVGMVVGLAAGVVLTVHSFYGEAKVPEGLGELFVGVAALLGVLLSAKGFGRWEHERRLETQAEVAGDALTIAWEVRAVVRRVAKDILPVRRSITPADPQIQPQGLLFGCRTAIPTTPQSEREKAVREEDEKRLRERWEEAGDSALRERIDKARARAEANLSHEAVVAFESLVASYEATLESIIVTSVSLNMADGGTVYAMREEARALFEKSLGETETAYERTKTAMRSHTLLQ